MGFLYSSTQAVPVSTLDDGRFDWKGKKKKTFRLARVYEMLGDTAKAGQAAGCATWLQYGVDAQGSKTLTAANFCKGRLCPLCNARRARRAAVLLSKVMNAAQERRPGLQFVFLTLTVRNCPGAALGDTITSLTSAWARLTHHRRVSRAVAGWFRAIEITRNRETGEYHPHIHAILAVDEKYFDRDTDMYITLDEWITRWAKALRVDYLPSVDIKSTYARGKKRGSAAAAAEAAKYPTKDAEYLNQAPVDREGVVNEDVLAVVRDYTTALAGRRLSAFGGLLRVIAKELKAENVEDGDLVHTDEGEVRSDLFVMLVTYRWNLGLVDYELDHVEEVGP